MSLLGLVVAHLVLALVLPSVAHRSRRAAFGVGALLPAATLVWALAHAGEALGPGVTSTTQWAPELGLTLDFRLDALALVMIVLVSGIGTLILIYSGWYFGSSSTDAPRSAALLVAFAGIMLGLVLADDLLTLYVFWELTSIASFLLVGQSGQYRENRRAAVQALLVTVLGGLAMLLGLVILGEAAGTYRISEIVASPPSGGAVTVGLMLILLGAITKSAQLPFHPWLPHAMAAPTPISAYLHAASMVKAGVFLVARLSPGFADRIEWWLPLVVLGVSTMLVGGWRALQETDLKRLLAFGTVSQLGFLMTLFGAGGRIAGMAGVAMLLAHGLFKAPLFMVVGTIDKTTGTRDCRKLSGLGRARPGLALLSALAGASMAGLPPLLGFVGKEAAFEAFLHEGGVRGWVIALGLLAGSVLTVAYTLRFLWGAFADKEGVEPIASKAPAAGLTAPAWVSAVAGLVLGVLFTLVQAPAAAYGDRLVAADAEAADYYLALWHGLGLPLLFSAVALAGGLLLHLQGVRVRATNARLGHRFSAQRGYEVTVSGLEKLAVIVTGRLQVGSLPAYLSIILGTLLLLPGVVGLVAGVWPDDQLVFHSLLQLPVGVMVAVASLALVKARRRLTAVLLVGAIGYGIGALFIIDGAPDLALAQFLVETLTLVVFVFVLRRLPAHFEETASSKRIRIPKAIVAGAAGIAMAAFAVMLSGARDVPPAPRDEFIARAPDAGATNIISAILVDFRALDTVGEITILLIAAAGTASLVFATRFDRRNPTSPRESPTSEAGSPEHEKEVLG
ncbi:MAG: hydrogen gas-evolving membrane-bound hydrogenase subunit E [Pseudonocardia sediminis]